MKASAPNRDSATYLYRTEVKVHAHVAFDNPTVIWVCYSLLVALRTHEHLDMNTCDIDTHTYSLYDEGRKSCESARLSLCFKA